MPVLLEPRAELRPDARAALHERARHAGAQRLPLSHAEQPRRFRLRVLARRRRDATRRAATPICSTSRCSARSDQLEVLAGFEEVSDDAYFEDLGSSLERHEPDALEPLPRSHVLRAELVAADALAELSDHRSRVDGRRTSVRARAANGVRRPLARTPLDVRLEHGARELRSQRRHDRLAARLDPGGELALRARRHVLDAGGRVPPNELLDRQSGAGRRRHC